MGNVATQSFISTTTWTAPAGVYFVWALGCGGGGGGGGGGNSNDNGCSGGGGGGGAIASMQVVNVAPGTTYTITIGNGGAGGSGVSGAAGNNGGFGIKSTFDVLATWVGASGGAGGSITSPDDAGGGAPLNSDGTNIYTSVETDLFIGTTINAFLAAGAGGFAPFTSAGGPGSGNAMLNSPGTGGTAATGAGGGGGGASGPFGAGTNGANGKNGSPSLSAGGAGGNSGAGGGGGGGQNSSSLAGGSGGNGGSGFIQIWYFV